MTNLDTITSLGKVQRRGTWDSFGIRARDRDRHMYIIGQTGTGKSSFLETMAVQDIRNGEGVIFMDPHGQSAEKLLHFVPESRVDDVIYFSPSRQDYPIGLNVMEDMGYDRRSQVVSNLMAAFHKLWGEEAWSDRMAYILNNTLLALLEYPGSTLLDVGRMYSDKDFRKTVVDSVKDPIVKRYWTADFVNYPERYIQEATPAIQNKLGQFTSNPLMRNIIGQKKSSFDFREVMDTRKILIVNLSKGQIGENDAKMLGTLLTTKAYLAALSRADMSPDEVDAAPPCHFYVDEFQSFANSSFADILSEARKYKLCLVLAHQYIGQIKQPNLGTADVIRDAVFGNVGTFVSFAIGPVDAEIVSKQFGAEVTPEKLVALPRFHIMLKLNINGAASAPFGAVTLKPDPIPAVSFVDRVMEHSDMTYGIPREQVEREIRERTEKKYGSQKKKPKKDNREKKLKELLVLARETTAADSPSGTDEQVRDEPSVSDAEPSAEPEDSPPEAWVPIGELSRSDDAE